MLFNQVERELAYREKNNEAIKVGIAGTGFIGRGLINQIELIKGIRLTAVANRNLEKALTVIKQAGYKDSEIAVCRNETEIKNATSYHKITVFSDMQHLPLTEADVIVDCTGDPKPGAILAKSALDYRINYIAAPEMDSVAGPALKRIADDKGVVYSGADGDEPGVTIGLFRYVSMLGFKVVAAGKFKSFYNPHANPDTVKPWADKYAQNPYMIASFADGTKMNIEMAILANASGLVPDKRGMHCPEGTLNTVSEILNTKEQGGILSSTGVVEVVLNVEPSGGVFVVASTTNRQIMRDLQYLKMGRGPNYLFYRPYHLCSIEMVITIIRASIHGEATIAPQKRVAGVLTAAKKDLKPGDILDNIGGYSFYGQIEKEHIIREQGLLPVALAPGVRIVKHKKQNDPVTIKDVEIDTDSLLYRFWKDE